jgi:hypothetical protein
MVAARLDAIQSQLRQQHDKELESLRQHHLAKQTEADRVLALWEQQIANLQAESSWNANRLVLLMNEQLRVERIMASISAVLSRSANPEHGHQ